MRASFLSFLGLALAAALVTAPPARAGGHDSDSDIERRLERIERQVAKLYDMVRAHHGDAAHDKGDCEKGGGCHDGTCRSDCDGAGCPKMKKCGDGGCEKEGRGGDCGKKAGQCGDGGCCSKAGGCHEGRCCKKSGRCDGGDCGPTSRKCDDGGRDKRCDGGGCDKRKAAACDDGRCGKGDGSKKAAKCGDGCRKAKACGGDCDKGGCDKGDCRNVAGKCGKAKACGSGDCDKDDCAKVAGKCDEGRCKTMAGDDGARDERPRRRMLMTRLEGLVPSGASAPSPARVMMRAVGSAAPSPAPGIELEIARYEKMVMDADTEAAVKYFLERIEALKAKRVR